METGERKAPTFLVVYDLSLVVLVHLGMVDARISNIAVDSSIRSAFVGDRLEESRATRPGAAED